MSVKTIYLMDENVWLPQTWHMKCLWFECRNSIETKQERQNEINHWQCGVVTLMAATANRTLDKRFKIKSTFSTENECSHFLRHSSGVFSAFRWIVQSLRNIHLQSKIIRINGIVLNATWWWAPSNEIKNIILIQFNVHF